MNKSLFDGLESLPAVLDWAELPCGHLVVVDLLEDFPQFTFLACRRNEDGGFTLYVHFSRDNGRTFCGYVELVSLPLDDVKVVGELERLGLGRAVNLLTSHTVRLAS